MKRLFVLCGLLLALPTWPATSGTSIYELNAALTTQEGKSVKLDVDRGHPTLITMFYGSCPNVCPLLFETMQRMERELNAQQKSPLRVLMISIDPERDTPAALTKLATSHRADLTRWTLAQAKPGDVRKIAAVLNVQYRRLPNGEFNHSSVITLLNPNGKIVASTSQLGSLDRDFIEALQKELKN